ncbi:MAG TPA: MFS transporter, partial [Allosphingosinicella sp.]
WYLWQSRTSFAPFGALLARKVKWRAANPGWIALGGGFLLWLVVTGLHAPLASPFGWFARGIG